MKDSSHLSLEDQSIIQDVIKERESIRSDFTGKAYKGYMEFFKNIPVLGDAFRHFSDGIGRFVYQGLSKYCPHSTKR